METGMSRVCVRCRFAQIILKHKWTVFVLLNILKLTLTFLQQNVDLLNHYDQSHYLHLDWNGHNTTTNVDLMKNLHVKSEITS